MKANRACILVCLALAIAASAAETQRGVTVIPVSAVAPGGNAGLFVGVNKFTKDQTLRSLSFAVNDAIAQAHLFVVELKLLPPANACLALSGEPSGDAAKTQLNALTKAGMRRVEATKSDILSSLLSIGSIARDPSDLVVVSISSHGFEERGVAYILPTDGLRGAMEETGLNLVSVEQKLGQSKASKRLLLIDACREQPTTDTRNVVEGMSTAFRSALATAKGQAVLASCDAGQMSIENTDLGHGVFTHFLVKALRGEAAADARGFITLGSVTDYVAKSVHDWVERNKPGTDQRLVQRPWFKGPKVAEEIPLAVDSGIKTRQTTFKNEAAQIIETLKTKINRKGEFTAGVYDRLAERLEQAQEDDAGRNLLKKSKDFAEGKLDEDVFVAFLGRLLETPRQQPSQRAPEAVDQKKAERIGFLLATAQANDSPTKGRTALKALDELLNLDPTHTEALALRSKILLYYEPPQRRPATSSGAQTSQYNPGAQTCFIATAAYGTPWEENVVKLRCFRERCLLSNRVGTHFVNWYYNVSPPVAAFIADRAWARSATRVMLTPVVLVSGAMLGDGEDIFVLMVGVISFLAAVAFVKRWKACRVEPHA